MGLDQLVAPIALYPDPLVAQILTASTYPQQVSDADNWSHQTAGLPPQQRADIANGMPWDPSVKALTAFPSVLDNMARNYNWTSALGNAYYNQPGDVMNAVQAARVQAQQAGYLRSTPQQRVYYSGGQILIAPVNPERRVRALLQSVAHLRRLGFALRGLLCGPAAGGLALGLGLGFAAVGISIGLFAHYGWGFHIGRPTGAAALCTITTPPTFRAALRYTITATLAATTAASSSMRAEAFHRTSIQARRARGLRGDRLGIGRGSTVPARRPGQTSQGARVSLQTGRLTLQHSPAGRAAHIGAPGWQRSAGGERPQRDGSAMRSRPAGRTPPRGGRPAGLAPAAPGTRSNRTAARPGTAVAASTSTTSTSGFLGQQLEFFGSPRPVLAQ